MNEKEPDIYFFNQKTTSDQDREFNDILADIKRRDRLSHLEDERLLLEMNDEQEFEQETILSGLQRMKTESSFLGTFMNDELDGFSVGVKVERTETFRDKPKRSNSCKNAFTAPVVPETVNFKFNPLKLSYNIIYFIVHLSMILDQLNHQRLIKFHMKIKCHQHHHNPLKPHQLHHRKLVLNLSPYQGMIPMKSRA